MFCIWYWRKYENRICCILLLIFVPVNAHASERGYITQRTCFTETYREEKVVGSKKVKGYVKSFLDRVQVPCSPWAKVHHHLITSYNSSRTRYYRPTTTYRVSRSNSSSSACRSSRAIGGVLAGSFAAAISQKDAWSCTILWGAVIGLGVGDTNC